MACFILPGRNLIMLFVLLYFVLLFCCHASCVLVNVTRNERDIFSYPGIFKDCSGFCQKRKSYPKHDLTKIGICICQCEYDIRTFVTAELKCKRDKEIRNTRQTSLEFKLYENEQPGGPLNISFHPVTIMFLPPNFYNEICDLNDIEELSDEHLWQWDSVKHLLLNYSIIEIDDDDIERRFTWLAMKYEGWMMLRLNWGVNPDSFVGRIMRINVTCENSKNTRPKKHKTGVMVFKVNGTFRVQDNTIPTSTVAPVVSTTYYLTPTPSTESSVFVYSTTSMILSTTMTSSLLIPMTSSSLQPMMSSSFQTMMSSLETMTSSSLETMTSSSLETMTSSSLETITSSSLETMTSSSLETMTSTPLETETSSSQGRMTSSSISPSRSSFSVLTESVIYSSTLSSMVLSSSSMAVAGPAKTSKSSSNGAVTGGVVGGLVVLLLIVVLLVYVLRKRRRIVIREKHTDLGHINPNYPSLSNLQIMPALNNPLSDGVHVYENPEVVSDGTNRRSGVISIDSAAYDSCIVVENPSANQKVKSMYDNIPESPENTYYKALDPAKREPSAKYQSLIKNNEYSTVADSVSGAPIQEPLYSEVDCLPSPMPVRNGHGPRSPTPPPLTSRKSHTPVVAEPIYNELESSGNQAKGVTPKHNRNSAPPSLPPRQPHLPAVAEPIYNELENSGSHAQEHANDVSNELEESNESDGKNGPVYSEQEEDK